MHLDGWSDALKRARLLAGGRSEQRPYENTAGFEVSVTDAFVARRLRLTTKLRRGRVLGRRETMKFLRHLLVVLIFSCGFAQLAMGQQVVKVRIDAKELDRALLFQKLNEHGADHHMKFVLANQNYDYRIGYGTGQALLATGARQMQALRMPRRRKLSRGCECCAPRGSGGFWV
jgi:hypothetical protein